MFGKKKAAVVDAERVQAVVNLIPEYVDALIEERRTRMAHNAGLDARESHGPAERKLKKVEARIAELLGSKPRNTPKEGLTCSQQRRFFLFGTSRSGVKAQRGNVVFGDCAGRDLIKPEVRP